jgi:hypothetical protein
MDGPVGFSVESQGLTRDAQELKSRAKNAVGTDNWQYLQKRLEEAQHTDQERANWLKQDLLRNIQTVFRVDGGFAGYVSEDAITRLDGQARFASDAELDRIRSDSSLSQGQRADRLSARIGDKLTERFGASVEIEQYAPGEGPTLAELRTSLNDDFETASQLLEAEREQMNISPQAFAEVFGEE